MRETCAGVEDAPQGRLAGGRGPAGRTQGTGVRWARADGSIGNMDAERVMLHGGALGDLALTLQLAVRLPGVDAASTLRVVSRVNPGDLSACRPSIVWQSPEGRGLHWLFGGEREGIPAGSGARRDSRTSGSGSHTSGSRTSGNDDPPARLRELVCGARVLNALDGVDSIVHRRLRLLEPAELHSLDPRAQAGVERHITEQWAAQLAAQGLRCVDRPVRRLWHRLPTGDVTGKMPVPPGAVVIHPGSGGERKCWPLACFCDVARRLRESGLPVAFLVGPVEAEKWPAGQLDALAGEFELVRSPEPDELVAILAAARVFVGNDAGPTHLAALLGTPTVALFGPTPASVWRPLGPAVRLIVGDPQPSADGWGISPDAVAAAVRAWRG